MRLRFQSATAGDAVALAELQINLQMQEGAPDFSFWTKNPAAGKVRKSTTNNAPNAGGD
jgi:hypothetical protein